MPVTVQVIMCVIAVVYAAAALVVRQRARRRGDWQTERRVRLVGLGLLLLFFGYRAVVTDDTVTRLFNGVSVLVIVAFIASLCDEKPRV